jgi:hypothetical protein
MSDLDVAEFGVMERIFVRTAWCADGKTFSTSRGFVAVGKESGETTGSDSRASRSLT